MLHHLSIIWIINSLPGSSVSKPSFFKYLSTTSLYFSYCSSPKKSTSKGSASTTIPPKKPTAKGSASSGIAKGSASSGIVEGTKYEDIAFEDIEPEKIDFYLELMEEKENLQSFKSILKDYHKQYDENHTEKENINTSTVLSPDEKLIFTTQQDLIIDKLVNDIRDYEQSIARLEEKILSIEFLIGEK